MLFSLGKRDDSLLPLYLFHRAKIEGGKRSSNETLRPSLPSLEPRERGRGEEGKKRRVERLSPPFDRPVQGHVPLAKLSEVVGG